MHYTELLNNKYWEGCSNLWYRHVVTIQKEDTSEAITTMTDVAYYDLPFYYNNIAKNLTQGATEVTIFMTRYFYSEVTIARVDMTV